MEGLVGSQLTAAAAIFLVIALTPVQDQQCLDPSWAKLHPEICYGGPFGIGGGAAPGGGGGGGLLGTIGKVLGGLGL